MLTCHQAEEIFAIWTHQHFLCGEAEGAVSSVLHKGPIGVVLYHVDPL